MKERGFSYFPIVVDPGSVQSGWSNDNEDLSIPWLPESLEEVQRVGYGLSSPYEMGTEEDITPEAVEKNTEYRESLSAHAQREYDLALNGYYDFDSASDPDPESCWSQAQVRFPEPPAPTADWSFLEPLSGMFSALSYEYAADGSKIEYGPYALQADPRFAELNKEYCDCVKATAGDRWNASNVSDIEGPVYAAIQTAPDGSEFDWPTDGKPIDTETIPIENRALIGAPLERDIAVDDFKCRQETDYVVRYAQIMANAENRYIEDHRAEIDQMMAGIERYLQGE
jgi:hypothetical protein